MARQIKIDFVSDIACPWCAIGLKGLQEALARLDGEVSADVHFRPYELNPTMAREGQSLNEILMRKYGKTPAELVETRAVLRDRAAAVGFTIPQRDDSFSYNTFDAHRLLYWADGNPAQAELKLALFEAYFTRGDNVAEPAVLLAAVEQAGLDVAEAKGVLESDRFADDVRAEEALWQSRGITSVPSIVVNEKYLISGGQPPEAFEQTLRQIAAEMA